MWVKVCGWNDPAVLQQSLGVASPDAIGLNFYGKSVRSVTVPAARTMRLSLPPEIAAVGVFVNHQRDEVLDIAEAVGLTHLQLHGDESPEFAASFSPWPLIRVYRLKEPSLQSIEQDLTRLKSLGVTPWACLVDAWHDSEYGGTGQTAPWQALIHWPKDWPPLILAGGLTPANVTEAIHTVRPFGVDTASGVEIVKGQKSPDLVREFVSVCRAS